MRKLVWVILLVFIACWLGGPVAAQQQRVLIFVPPGFSYDNPLFEELIWRLVRGVGAEVAVVAPDAELAQALDQRLLQIEREIARSVREGQAPGGVEVTEENRRTHVVQYHPAISPRPAELMEDFHKIIFFDSGKWRSALKSEDARAGYAQEISQGMEMGAVFGAWGYGVLPLVESGLLPIDAVVAIPPDVSLGDVCSQYNVKYLQPRRPWTVKGKLPVFTPHAVYWRGDGWGLFTSSIPSYICTVLPTEYDHFQEAYGSAIEDFVNGLEGAYYGELSPGIYWDISDIPPWSGEVVTVPPPGEGPPAGGQTAVVCLPPLFHDQPGYHASEFEPITQGLIDEGASQIVVVPWDPLEGPEAERLVGQVDPTGDIVTVSPWEELPADTEYDKAIWLGGMGWYPLAYHELPQDEEEEILTATKEIAQRAHTIAAVGTGLYPLIMADVFPPGTPVGVYPCKDLMRTCSGKGLKALPPQGAVRKDPRGLPLPPAKFVLAQANGKKFLTASIPDGWYTADEGDLLLQYYGAAIDSFVTYLEQAWRGDISPGWTAEVGVGATPETETSAQPTRPIGKALVIIFPSFHDQELETVENFLEEQGIPWTVAAWDEVGTSSLKRCSPRTLRGQYGSSVRPDTWAWCADAAEYDLVLIVGGRGVSRLFPCWRKSPSRAKSKLFELLQAFREAGKPIFAVGTAPVVLAEAGLLDGLWATVYKLYGREVDCLVRRGAMVRTPPGMPREVAKEPVFDRGIVTFYAQESTRWALNDKENFHKALSTAYRETTDWITSGSPTDWPFRPPEW